MPIAADATVAWSVRLYVRLSHSCTLQKAAGLNEMPFDRDTRVVPSNIVLGRHSGPLQEGEICGSEPSVKICFANCDQTITDRQLIGTHQRPIQRSHHQTHIFFPK